MLDQMISSLTASLFFDDALNADITEISDNRVPTPHQSMLLS